MIVSGVLQGGILSWEIQDPCFLAGQRYSETSLDAALTQDNPTSGPRTLARWLWPILLKSPRTLGLLPFGLGQF